MENLIVITVGLILLIPWLAINKNLQLNFCLIGSRQYPNKQNLARRIMEYSTNGVYGGSRNNGFSTNSIQPHHPTADMREEEKEEERLTALSEKELIEEKSKLEKQLKKISRKLLAEEKRRLQQRLNEIDKEINAK